MAAGIGPYVDCKCSIQEKARSLLVTSLAQVGPLYALEKEGGFRKGDMRAQIEQVGKNVGACLKASGATVNDIAFTITSVTAPADFEKYADLLPRYFGPPSPESKTVPTAQLSNPDFLLQVEAFAAIK